uniref:RBD domain-containing protein n=1 Tax=Electrophorus electricus TaxID=8005 RepID=A0A4W4F273_ELEEL
MAEIPERPSLKTDSIYRHTMEQEDVADGDLSLTVQVPGGQETSVTVNSSKPVMDLLISLCAQYHLNPSDHFIELISTNQNHIKFKPSSLIGSLEAERVVLKPKGSEDNTKRVPNMPIATVRLIINYRQSHKAVVRVNPRVPLAELLPAVCDKCEFDPNSTILLRDSQSEHPLDLTKTLNDYGIRDLYAKDTKAVSSASKDTTAPTHKGCKKEKLTTVKKGQEEKENRGLFSLFRRSKKMTEEVWLSSPCAPVCLASCEDQPIVEL